MSMYVFEGVIALRDSARHDDPELAARERSTAHSQRTLFCLRIWIQSLVLSST